MQVFQKSNFFLFSKLSFHIIWLKVKNYNMLKLREQRYIVLKNTTRQKTIVIMLYLIQDNMKFTIDGIEYCCTTSDRQKLTF